MTERCECPDAGWDHAADRCPRPGWRRYRRGTRILQLCWDCNVTGDVCLDPEPELDE